MVLQDADAARFMASAPRADDDFQRCIEVGPKARVCEIKHALSLGHPVLVSGWTEDMSMRWIWEDFQYLGLDRPVSWQST